MSVPVCRVPFPSVTLDWDKIANSGARWGGVGVGDTNMCDRKPGGGRISVKPGGAKTP